MVRETSIKVIPDNDIAFLIYETNTRRTLSQSGISGSKKSCILYIVFILNRAQEIKFVIVRKYIHCKTGTSEPIRGSPVGNTIVGYFCSVRSFILPFRCTPAWVIFAITELAVRLT